MFPTSYAAPKMAKIQYGVKPDIFKYALASFLSVSPRTTNIRLGGLFFQ